MSEPVASRGRGRGRGGGRSSSARQAAPARATQESEADEDQVKDLRRQYGAKLGVIQEIYPGWSEQDLLFTLKEAHGDLETAAARISEGHAQQWDSVKTKKTKQSQKQATPFESSHVSSYPSSASLPTRGGSRPRGEGRGRGGFAARGARGGRGGRGGLATSIQPASAPAHQELTNGHAATSAPPTGETPAREASSSNAGPWGVWGAAPPAAAPAPAPAPEASGWGDEEPSETPAKAPTATASKPAAPPPAATQAKRPAGSALSWAQIARPPNPPKPTVAIPAQPTSDTNTARPTLEQDEPEEAVQELPAPVKQPANDPWASTPAASVVSSFPNAPLGVGEGWAETVLSNNAGDEVAANQQAYHHAAGSPNLAQAMPEGNADPAGPIDVTDAAKPTYEQPKTELGASTNSVAAQLENQVEAQQQQKEQRSYAASSQPAPGVAGPPGFAQKPKQDPVAGNVDRIGVQFGSLGLFDQAAPQPQEKQAANRSPEHQDRQSYAQAPGNAAQPLPSAPFGPYAAFAGAAGQQQPPQPAPPAPAFGAYSPQYAPFGQLPNGNQARTNGDTPSFPGQPQNAAPQQHSLPPAPSVSPYAPLGSEQQQQQGSYLGGHPGQNAQQPPQPSSYAAFHSIQAAQQPQNAHAHPYNQNDYSPVYGMPQRPDQVPSAYGAYSNYSEQAAPAQPYGRQSAGLPDDKQAPPAQPAPSGQSQPAASPMAQQQHPGAANFPANYGFPYYYGAYGQPYSAPGYQQAPYAAYYNASPLQNVGTRPGGYQQQQQPAINAGYRANIPAPANYGQQGYFPGYPVPGHPGGQQERDRSSYKNPGFSDF